MFKFHPFLAATAVPVVLGCFACGASFTSVDGNGAATGTGNAGAAAGGLTSSAGSSSVGDAGELEAGGTSSAGQGSIVGPGGTTSGSGGTTTGAGGTTTGAAGWGSGRGGWGNGGWWPGSAGTGGTATAADCATLRQDYETAVDKARVCDKGSTDQCSPSSTAQPVGGCGCAVLINATSEAGAAAKKAYQAYLDAKCDAGGGVVCNIFCAPATSASCDQQAMGSGNTFMCTGSTSLQK